MKTHINHIPVHTPTADELSRLLCASIELEDVKKELKIVKAMVKLTDFSSSELNTMLSAVSAYMMDKQSHAAYYERYKLYDIGAFKKVYQTTQKEIDNSVNLIVQITTAIDAVNARETTNAN